MKQLEDEDFESFLVAIRQIAENADLCEGHCQDCTKAQQDKSLLLGEDINHV